MLIHTWFFLACLPVLSHVWGRVGQGKEPACPCEAVPCGLSVPWDSPALPVGSGTTVRGIPKGRLDFRGLLCSGVCW